MRVSDEQLAAAIRNLGRIEADPALFKIQPNTMLEETEMLVLDLRDARIERDKLIAERDEAQRVQEHYIGQFAKEHDAKDELLRQARRAMGRLSLAMNREDNPMQAASDAWSILHAVIVSTESEESER